MVTYVSNATGQSGWRFVKVGQRSHVGVGKCGRGVHAVEVEHFVAQERRDAMRFQFASCQAASEDGCIAVAEVRKSG